MSVEQVLNFFRHLRHIVKNHREVDEFIAEIERSPFSLMEFFQPFAGDCDGRVSLSHGYSIAEFGRKASFKFVFFSVDSSLGKLMLTAIFIDHDDDADLR